MEAKDSTKSPRTTAYIHTVYAIYTPLTINLANFALFSFNALECPHDEHFAMMSLVLVSRRRVISGSPQPAHSTTSRMNERSCEVQAMRKGVKQIKFN